MSLVFIFLLITGHHAGTNIALLPGCGTPGQREAKHKAGRKAEMWLMNASAFCVLFVSRGGEGKGGEGRAWEGGGRMGLPVHKELVQLTFAPQGFIGDWSKAGGEKVDL